MKSILALAAILLTNALLGAEPGSSVVVIYNSKMKESKQVADYYAQKRDVPAAQVMGFALPETETISRGDYVEKLEKPLLKQLEAKGLFVMGSNSIPSKGVANPGGRRVAAARIRYAVLCYGVPLKISPDPDLKEVVAEQLEAQLRRNEASVDSQLTILPLSELGPPWAGPVTNPFFGTTNAAMLQPTNGILLVTRLDGPTAEIARGLVDKAMQAEAEGLWGRAYVDGRGITNGGYKL
ncbi:MAG TPA: TIGR03790 family protein, partial [Patescibacteria group bacterium]|nr:TIGR03790 family protein [Patescibacteria group bacterium]